MEDYFAYKMDMFSEKVNQMPTLKTPVLFREAEQSFW